MPHYGKNPNSMVLAPGSCAPAINGLTNCTPYPGPGGYVQQVRIDGYTYGTYTFQGVRIFDSNSSQWLSPDAYAGEARDPMSQEPFIWNNNNPFAYVNPTGYDPQLNGTPEDQAEVSTALQQLETAASNLSDTDRNSLVKGLAQFLSSAASDGFTINIDDNAVDLQYNSSGGVSGATIANYDTSNPMSITVHMGSVDALAAQYRGEALQQGLANDIGTMATFAGLIGNQSQQCEVRTDIRDDIGTKDDAFSDDFANYRLLSPLGLRNDQ